MSEGREQFSEKDLRRDFMDNLGQPSSMSAILFLRAHDSGSRHFEIGIPYEIQGNNLVVGPYVKKFDSCAPPDYDARKREIPISSILWYKRVEFRD